MRSAAAAFVLMVAACAHVSPRPVVVMRVTGAFGHRWPECEDVRVALYDDGHAIVCRDDKYVDLRLSSSARSALVASLHLDAVSALPAELSASDNVDDENISFETFAGGKLKEVEIHGSLGVDEVRAKAPQTLVTTYDALVHLAEDRSATPWTPAQLELYFTPVDSTCEAVSWPKNWPGAPRALVDARRLDAILALVGKTHGVVEIGAQKYGLSILRPFPSEALWTR